MRTIGVRKLLYRSRVEYASYGINHYKGCEHGCVYCYSMRRAIRFKECRNRRDWLNPKVVKNAVPMLVSELGKVPELRLPSEWAWLCPATDGYQPIEDELHLTSDILKELVARGIKVKILTKSESVTNDEDTIIRHKDLVTVGMTITCLDDDLARKSEPNASLIHDRVKTVRYFHANDVKTWVSLEPILDNAPEAVLEHLKDDVDWWTIGKDNYVKRPLPYREIRDRVIMWFRAHGMINYLIKKELRNA